MEKSWEIEKLLTKLKAVTVVSPIAVKSGSMWDFFFFLFLIDLKIPICDLKWLFNLSRCCYQISYFVDI